VNFFFFFILKCFSHVACYLDNKSVFSMDTKLGVKEKQNASVCHSSPTSVEGQGGMEVLPKENDQDEGRLRLCCKMEVEGLWGVSLEEGGSRGKRWLLSKAQERTQEPTSGGRTQAARWM